MTVCFDAISPGAWGDPGCVAERVGEMRRGAVAGFGGYVGNWHLRGLKQKLRAREALSADFLADGVA